MTARAAILTVLLTGLALAGCASSKPRPIITDTADLHRPVVTEDVTRLDLLPAYDGVALSDAPAIAAFVREYRDAGHGPLVVSSPPGENPAIVADDVRAIAADMGVSLQEIALATSTGGPGSPYNLSFVRYRAIAPECGQEWPSLAQTARSENYSNFGCAMNANLAAMIADPADLEWPREMTPADAQRRTTVIQRYRAGEATASVRGDQDRASVSGD